MDTQNTNQEPLTVNAKELFHHWAHQARDAQRCGNVFYTGPTCYSYGMHFPIATLKKIGKDTVVLFNPRSYSRSTARHQYHARRAVSHLESHTVHVDEWNTINNRRTLAAALKRQAKRDQADAKTAREAKNAEARRKRQEKRYAARALPELIQEWRDHKRSTCPRTPFALLRFSQDRSRVETSQNATVPALDARRLFDHLQTAPQPFHAPEATLGFYRGISLADGILTIGCHKIEWTEAKRLFA